MGWQTSAAILGQRIFFYTEDGSTCDDTSNFNLGPLLLGVPTTLQLTLQAGGLVPQSTASFSGFRFFGAGRVPLERATYTFTLNDELRIAEPSSSALTTTAVLFVWLTARWRGRRSIAD